MSPPRGPAPALPPDAGRTARYLAVGLDSYLCLLTVGLTTRPHLESAGPGEAALTLVSATLAFSFVNQVLLPSAVRASAGMLIMGVRVIGVPDAGRPGPLRLVRRWGYGLCLLPVQPWRLMRAAGPWTLARETAPHPARPVPPPPDCPFHALAVRYCPTAAAGPDVVTARPVPYGHGEGGVPADLAGIRQVRRGDLLAHRAATGRG
ncbi:RDD family protein [uncultured Streptomyces sp.]|uniref:RDD family protein n=1 Tax=uncultured Streptomyces sp. TaxID=174707 RepID=UPI002617A587|nr:RDD family protein [uncultured Streptomyces sp.]